ncbi:VOC family protein [Candidatus Thorarchaeota archaeon]|nr:MAG: VOC family protein [Candidatus Thorarchaeota archaeon]
MKLAYIRLLVQKFDECFCFYRDVMGFPVTWGNEGENYASFRIGDGTSLSIFTRGLLAEVIGTSDLPNHSIAQDSFALIFGVESVDNTILNLKKKGANIIFQPVDNPRWGIRIAYVRDPDGNLIEINSPMPIEDWSDELQEELENNPE